MTVYTVRLPDGREIKTDVTPECLKVAERIKKRMDAGLKPDDRDLQELWRGLEADERRWPTPEKTP